MFDELLEQDEFVQRQRERAREEGETKASQQILVDIVRRRFPTLTELAQQRAEATTQAVALQEIIGLVSTAPDEATARFILSAPSSAA